MSEIEEYLNSLIIINVNDITHTHTLIKTIGYGIGEEKYSKATISFINKQLAGATTRDKGFEILQYVLPSCPFSVLQENCLQWANFAVSHHPSETIARCRLQFLVGLLKRVHTNKDFQKSFISSLLLKIVDSCIAVHIKTNEAWYSLDCLITCMKLYPSSCIVYKNKVETYALSFLDCPGTVSVLDQAATCLHYTNQIGGAGPGGVVHIKNFNNSLMYFCNTLHSLYDVFFENINEYENYNTDVSNSHKFCATPTNLSKNETYRILSKRLRNVITFITKTLECSFPVIKTFNPEILISAIKRGMAVHVHMGEMKEALFAIILQEHQVHLMHLLKALIICLRNSFIRFLSIKVLQEYLNRTNNCTCYKLNSEYLETIYEVIACWITNSGEHIDSITYDKIVQQIITHISPVKTSLVLNIEKSDQKSTKAKKKAVENKVIKSTEIGESETAIKVVETTENVCYQALRTLEVLLRNVCFNVKQNTSWLLFDTIVKSLLSISVNVHEPPYTNRKCRISLYKVFITIFDQNIATLDLGLAVNILSLGQRNTDNEISNICTGGLGSLEKLCQPIHPALYMNYETNHKNIIEQEKSNILFDSENVSDAEMEELQVEVDSNADYNEEEVIENTNETHNVNGNSSSDNNEDKNIKTTKSTSNKDELNDSEIIIQSSKIDTDNSRKENNCEIIEDICIKPSNLQTELTMKNGTTFSNDEVKVVLEDISVKATNEYESSPKRFKKSENFAIKSLDDDFKSDDMLSSFVDEVN